MATARPVIGSASPTSSEADTGQELRSEAKVIIEHFDFLYILPCISSYTCRFSGINRGSGVELGNVDPRSGLGNDTIDTRTTTCWSIIKSSGL